MSGRLRKLCVVMALAGLSATPAAAIRVPEPAGHEASAAELIRDAQHPVAEAAAPQAPFEAAIAGYHATTSWMGLPEQLDLAPFLAAFLKGAALLAAVYAISQRRVLFGMRRRF
jgi:hypothetical protein